MKSFLLTLLLCLHLFAWAGEKGYSKITLKSGNIYRGEIVLHNDEILMLKDSSGARFQFQINEIQKIEQLEPIKSDSTQQKPTITTVSNELISAQASISTGIGSVAKVSDQAYYYQVNLVFGKNNKYKPNMYTGVGIGYINVVQPNLNFGLVPLSYSLQISTSNKRTSFHWGLIAGYALSINKTVKGGLYSQLSAGYKIKLNQKNALLIALQTSVWGIETNLSEKTISGTYGYNGFTTLTLAGIKAGFQF